ncbi:DUF4097 domain-containing protein [Bacillaceae bacterium S4-13-56]
MSEEKKRILKLVEDGVLSAEEGLALLEKLEKPKEKTFEISTNVDWENEQERLEQGESNTSLRQKIFEFIDETIEKIKKVDLDLNFGAYEEVSHIFQLRGENFEDVIIDLSNGDLQIELWDDPDVRVECKAKVYHAKSKEHAKEFFLDHVDASVREGLFHFSSDSKKVKSDVKLYFPKHSYEKLVARLFNGTIQTKSMDIGKVTLKTANGKIRVEQLKAEELEVETSNGNILLEDVSLNECDVESINGKIQLVGAFSKVDVQTVNGSIDCQWKDGLPRAGFFRNTSGNINLTLPRHVQIHAELKTALGNTSCNLDDYHVIEERKDVLGKYLHVEAQKEQESTLHIDAESKTGSIQIQSNS